MPVKQGNRIPMVLRRLRGSEGEVSVMELNSSKWLADSDNQQSTFSLGEN